MVTLGPQCVFPTTFIGIWHGGGGFSLFIRRCLIFIQLLGLLRMLFSQQTHVCLVAGDFVGPSFSILPSPSFVMARDPDINSLELLAVVVACKLWGHLWSRRRNLLYYDNQATVSVINTGKSRNVFMNDCLRELWLIAAIHDFELRAVHLEGQSNRAADLLSRWHLNISNCVTFNAQFRGYARVERSVPERCFTFNANI